MAESSDHDPLPESVRQFAPWHWSVMEFVGYGLTFGAGCSAAWLLLTLLWQQSQ